MQRTLRMDDRNHGLRTADHLWGTTKGKKVDSSSEPAEKNIAPHSSIFQNTVLDFKPAQLWDKFALFKITACVNFSQELLEG